MYYIVSMDDHVKKMMQFGALGVYFDEILPKKL